jgi:hypothetical protein
LQELHKVADGEISRIALTVIPVLLSELECSNIWHGHNLAPITAAFENRLDQPFVFPRKATKKDGDFTTLLSGKRPLHWALKMAGARVLQIELLGEPRPFGGDPPLQFLFSLDVSI